MSNYKEIVTKAVLSKGKRQFTTTNSVEVVNPSTVLGCWVINHNFNGVKSNNDIIINGSYDVNIWYSSDNDTKTNVVKQTNQYKEVVHMKKIDPVDGEEVIIRSLKQPSCVKTSIDGNNITYTIEKELGIELVGDMKVKIEVNQDEEVWDEIVEEDKEITDKIDENFIKEDLI